MADRKHRVLEVLKGGMRHAKSLHQPLRAFIESCREGNDFPKTEALKAEGQRDLRGFQGISATPELSSKPPANLNTGRKMGLKVRLRQAGESRELMFDLNGPKAPSALIDASLQSFQRSERLLLGQDLWEELHDLAIGVHGGEWFQIGVVPLSQSDSWPEKVHSRSAKADAAHGFWRFTTRGASGTAEALTAVEAFVAGAVSYRHMPAVWTGRGVLLEVGNGVTKGCYRPSVD